MSWPLERASPRECRTVKLEARKYRGLWSIRHGYGTTQEARSRTCTRRRTARETQYNSDMSKVSPLSLSLSDRDKTPAPSGWGYHFHHTNPQRRVPCVLGDMLAPRSADDIPPITPEAMASVQAAITLLANLVGDQDHGRFLGCGEAKLEEYRQKAQILLSMGRSLAGILRVVTPPVPVEKSPLPSTTTATSVTPDELPLIDVNGTSPTITLCVQLSATEIASLAMAHEHACLSMSHPYSWGRDITMSVVNKVLTAAHAASPSPS